MLNIKYVLKFISISFLSLSLLSLTTTSLAADNSELKSVIDSKKLKTSLKEGANLASYKSFILEPVTATFKKGWVKKYNQEQRSLSHKMRSDDVIEVKGRIEKQFQISFAKYITNKANLTQVEKAGENTFRLKPVISKLVINGPDIQGATSKVIMVRTVGRATLNLEIYDATSNELLGTLMSDVETRDHHEMRRTNRIMNNSDFIQVYKSWARDFIDLVK